MGKDRDAEFVDALPDGTERVSFDAIDDEVVFDPQRDSVVATPARDGGGVVVATRPEEKTVIDNAADGSGYGDTTRLFLRTPEGEVPSGPSHRQSGTVEGAAELVWFTFATDSPPSRTGSDQRVLDNDDLLLRCCSTAGWTAPGGPAVTRQPWCRCPRTTGGGRSMRTSGCGRSGERSGTGAGTGTGPWWVTCPRWTSPWAVRKHRLPESQAYLISVLPTDVAQRATPVLRVEPGVSPEPVEWDEPETADLGNGTFLFIARGTVGPTSQAGSGLIGLDVDGDGEADDTWD